MSPKNILAEILWIFVAPKAHFETLAQKILDRLHMDDSPGVCYVNKYI